MYSGIVIGSEVHNLVFQALAAAFGAPARRVRDADALRDALAALLQEVGPSLI